MRSFKSFIYDVSHKPPLLFPLVALFHVAMLLYIVCSDVKEPYLWIQIIWMLGYTICWIYCCDLRKWAALGYLALTSIDLILYFSLKSPANNAVYTSSMFLLDVLFSFFILFFYRRFH